MFKKLLSFFLLLNQFNYNISLKIDNLSFNLKKIV